MRPARLGAIVIVAALAAGCGGKEPEVAQDTLTTHERQEALGNSGIPGARGINRALDAADTAAARNQRLDSIGQ